MLFVALFGAGATPLYDSRSMLFVAMALFGAARDVQALLSDWGRDETGLIPQVKAHCFA